MVEYSTTYFTDISLADLQYRCEFKILHNSQVPKKTGGPLQRVYNNDEMYSCDDEFLFGVTVLFLRLYIRSNSDDDTAFVLIAT